MESNMKPYEINLWRACAPLRKELGQKKPLWIVADENYLNFLCKMWPETYLKKLESMHNALRNQLFYEVKKDLVTLLCAAPEENGVKVYFVVLRLEENVLKVTDAWPFGIPFYGKLKAVKSESRKGDINGKK